MAFTRVIILLCVFSIALSKSVEEIKPQLSMVGEFEGKRYWMDTNTRYQQDAAKYCRDQGYFPVQFDSMDEIDFLSTRLEPARYWTAGVEKATPEQYVWTHGESSSPIELEMTNLVPFTGIYLDRADNTLKAEDIHTMMRPLCQELPL